jgi:hypothetical protein
MSRMLTPTMYFSYGQFMVYDSSEPAPGCLWTNDHYNQGFARRSATVCYRTLKQEGEADVTYIHGHFVPRYSYVRVIAVPFFSTTGRVLVEGPEEVGTGRIVNIPAGDYRLTCGQRYENNCVVVDLFFEKLERPLERSIVIVADSELSPPTELIESAEVA